MRKQALQVYVVGELSKIELTALYDKFDDSGKIISRQIYHYLKK